MKHPDDPTERFGPRAEHYRRWRPGYPPELVPWLKAHCGLMPGAIVADIGSGTGLFTRELLATGLIVHAVEPNAGMRAVAEAALASERNFRSYDGTAEHSNLRAASVQLVTAAQAFHWFDPPAARREFARILQPGGQVALIWNLRRNDTPFLAGYEALLREHAPEYTRSGRPAQADPAVLAHFFSGGVYSGCDFAYEQHFDREGLCGRLLSSSYAPAPGQPGHDAMIAALHALFGEHQSEGWVSFSYATTVFVGGV
jgi:SAM-dependent methyltransferase